MIVAFEKEYLKDLYTKGKSRDKKHRFQPDVIKRYKKGIDYLKYASRKEDLFRINSLNLEALKGDKAGIWSIRVSDQYRIEFRISENSEEPILTVCCIVELSNHYS